MRLFAGTPYDQPPKCDRCGALESECACPPLPAVRTKTPGQVARLSLEKRKRGKVVTVVRGLSAAANDLADLLSRLKSQCGAGGTTHDDGLEIQGEHIERIGDFLSGMGYRVKK